MNATAPFPPPRVTPDAGHALGGLWRLATRRYFTVRHWLTAAGALAALVVLSLPAAQTAEGAATGYLPWAAGFYVSFVVPLLAFINAAAAMRDDLRSGVADYLFTRPVRRHVFIGLRYLTQLGVSQLDFLLSFAVIAGIGAFWGVPGLAAALPTLLLGQVAAITVFTAVGLLCGLATSRYVIVGVLYGAIIEVGLGSVPTQISQISLVRHILLLVRPLIGEGGWAIATMREADAGSVPLTLAVLAAVAAAALGVAAALFSFREFTGAPTRDA